MGKNSRRLVECGALSIFCLLLVPLVYVLFFESISAPFDSWNLSKWSEGAGESIEERKSISFLLSLVRGKSRRQLKATGFSCHSDLHSEICLANKQIMMDFNKTLTVYLPYNDTSPQVNCKVQPYARKEDKTAMKAVTPVQISQGNLNPPACRFTHDVPAVVFSSGGFTGNLFHEFNEIIIPLFITCRHFRSRLQFVITDFKPRWVRKYSRILTHLSGYNIINPVEDGSLHCFPGAVIGLKYHDNLALNISDIPGGYSMLDFKHFLREAYDLKITNVLEMEKRLVVLLISRNGSRVFMNEDKMVVMLTELGFRVHVATPEKMSNLDAFAKVVNSCSVMVGVHGAGLTNSVFLPSGAVMVQVIPLGLDWASNNYYGGPAREMNVQYLEYKITPEESSLLDLYGRDHPVIADPESIFLKGYYAARAVYVDGQNVKINLVRFRETLVEAVKLLGHSVPIN